MTALVTGGGGFLGRHIVAALRARGEPVRVIGRSRYPDLEATEGVECRQADITDAPAVAAACEGVSVVYHVAALAGIWGPRATYEAINVGGTQHVIDGCRAQGVGRLVLTSSPSVVFGTEHLEGIDESAPYPERYLAHYPRTKAEAERRVLAANGPDLRTCALRPHLIWGPGDNHLIPRLLARARAGKLVRVGDGTNRVDTVHVTNAAAAHLQAADAMTQDLSPVPGSVYFISQGEPVCLWAFIDRILDGVGAPPISRSISFRTAWRVGALMEAAFGLFRIRSEPRMTRFLALQLSHAHWFDISKAREQLGYEPTVSTDAGLDQLVEALAG